jgi:hypothetical protein
MVPPENLKIDCVRAEYPDDPADSPQLSHHQISGHCRCCMHLVYHGCWLATCLPAVQDDFRRLPCEGGQDERRWRPSFPYRDERRAAIRSCERDAVASIAETGPWHAGEDLAEALNRDANETLSVG